MDVNIKVKENAHSNRHYLYSHGIQKELSLSETNNSDKQKF